MLCLIAQILKNQSGMLRWYAAVGRRQSSRTEIIITSVEVAAVLCMLRVVWRPADPLSLWFECFTLQNLRDTYENLFQAPQGHAMILFMWQDDIIGVARIIDAC